MKAREFLLWWLGKNYLQNLILIFNICIIILIDTELKLVLTLKNKEKMGFLTMKPLYEWAEDYFMADQVSVFLDFCKREFYKGETDNISRQVFLGLVENFKRGRWSQILFNENWCGFSHQFFQKSFISEKMITNCYRQFRHFDLKYKNHCL